ncbi:MAG: MetQ/NlpA family ABC transporter substrate-binding protein [Coriobacteriia bacterium]|nr:MetQ/NlpA family ABC transporter substrate-binding protein [Coriobacteriia bacterium]
MLRLRRTIACLAVLVLSMSMLTGCASKSADTSAAEEPAKLAPIRIGVLPTEDSLPLWVADKEGLFADAGLDVSFVNFQAAAERDAAFTAGEIDAFMGDMIAAALLEQGGSGATIGTIMLGGTPAEGRFGIAVPADSAYQDLSALAGVPVGTSSGTIQEYVLDGLMRQAGVPADKVGTEEVKKVPVRFELLMAGKLKAAALPEPFLSLAEAQGAKIIASDTEGENLSQTILGFSDNYLVAPGGIEAMTVLLDVWNEAVTLVNASPDAYRATLVEQARLPEPIKDSYKISVYPMADSPSQAQVDAVLAWMDAKKLLGKPVSFEDLVMVTP